MRQKKIAFNINYLLNQLIINVVIIKFFINFKDLIILNGAMKSLIKKWMQEWKYDISLKKKFEKISKGFTITDSWMYETSAVWNMAEKDWNKTRGDRCIFW